MITKVYLYDRLSKYSYVTYLCSVCLKMLHCCVFMMLFDGPTLSELAASWFRTSDYNRRKKINADSDSSSSIVC